MCTKGRASRRVSETLMKFTKIHGLGNDYLFIDATELEIPDPAELSKAMSHRRFGVGADGIILVGKSALADFKMRIFNADGSESEMCGNGLRGFGKYCYDHGLTTKERMAVETGAGVLDVQLLPEDGAVQRARINLGKPRLERAEIPMDGPPGRVLNEALRVNGTTVEVTAVSMGNPHCVIYVDDVEAAPVTELGPKIERHPIFPRRTNVEFVQIIERGEVRQRTWERGSGETWACGTGAAAVTVAGALTERTEKRLLIHLTGGDLEVEWTEEGEVVQTGATVEVFSGEWPAA
jgi:diaminopimelate epimerase